jgi:hypothetical protein
MKATELACALEAAGIVCTVEAWDGLAVIVPARAGLSLADDHLRKRVVALAREHGFTHAAVELGPMESGAALRRD